MLLSKLASLCSDVIHAKLIATIALHDKALLKTAWEINCLKVAYFLSLEEDMIKCNESILFSKLVFLTSFRFCQSEPNSPHNVCGFVSGMKTSITAIKEESRNKNLIILSAFQKITCAGTTITAVVPGTVTLCA